MSVIDCHIHLYPPELNAAPAAWAAAQGEGHWARLCARRRRDGSPVQDFPDVDGLLRALDAAGVARAILLGWYWEKPENCAWQNRFLARCARAHPDRLSACATLHPGGGRQATLDELDRAEGEGLVGVGELSPQAQGYPVADPVLAEVLERAAERKWPVNFHVTDALAPAYPGRVETPAEDFLGLAARHPRTTFILAHWGGMFPYRQPEAGWGRLTNVHYDTAASPLSYDAGVWARLLPVLGEDRVLFGSDHPLRLYPKLREDSGLGDFVAEARAGGASAGVLGGNAARLFRLPR